MRALTINERETLRTLLERGRIPALPKSNIKVFYDSHGNFTTATLRAGSDYASAAAKRSPRDNYSPEAGQAIAFVRAALKLFGDQQAA